MLWRTSPGLGGPWRTSGPSLVDVTILRVPARLGASSTRRVLITFTSESVIGLSIDRLFPTEAARWKTSSAPRIVEATARASRL